MHLVPLFQIDPRLAARDTRTFAISGFPGVPDGEYGVVEAYCPDPTCDCRRVMLNVVARGDAEKGKYTPLAAISYGFDRRARDSGPFLDPLNPQGECAGALLQVVKQLLADSAYVERLKSHYAVVKETVKKGRAGTRRGAIASAEEATEPPSVAPSEGSAPRRREGRAKPAVKAEPDAGEPRAGHKSAESVPLALRPTFEAVSKIAEAFCREHLDEEYAQLSRKLVAALCRKRPSPLLQGQPRVWAAAVVYALGSVNFLWDKSQTPHMTATELCERFGVGKSTASTRARQIMDGLRIRQADPRWYRPSRMDENPLAWLVQVDGLVVDIRTEPRELQEEAFRRGIIPYVPAAR